MDIKKFLTYLSLLFFIFFCFVGIIFFTIKIDETKIEKIRYCPHCGYDLIYNIEKK